MNITPPVSPITPGGPAGAGGTHGPAAPSHPPPAVAPAPEARTAGPRLVTREQLEAAVDRANDALQRDGSVRFAVHEGTNRVVVRIVDPESMEIIREFPDSDFLDMMAKLQELSGLQVDVQT